MTVSAQTSSKVSIAAAGATVFPYDFKIILATDLLVTVDGTTKVYNADYTLSGIGVDGGGDVTFLTPLIGGELVVRKRAMAYARSTDYQNLGDLHSASLNNDQDAPVLMIQQLATSDARSLKAPDASPPVSGELPTLVPLAPLVVNAGGTGFEMGSTNLTGDMLLRGELASSSAGKGGFLVRFIASGVGAVARWIMDKLRERVSVKDFGAVGDGVVDDTAAIQAALDSGAKRVLFPDPTSFYSISSALNLTASGITVQGSNQLTTLIKQTTASAKIFNNTGARNAFRDLRLEYSGTPTTGATAIHSSGSDTRINCVFVNSCYTGFYFTTAAGQMASQFSILNYVGAGVHCQAVTDVYCSQFIMNAGNATNGALGGVRLEDKCEAIVFGDGDVLNGVHSLFTTSAVYSAGNRPAFCNFSNVFFDSSAQGSTAANLVESEFVGCWFSGGRSGGGFPSLTLGQSLSVKFTNSRFFSGGTHGFFADSTAVRLQLTSCAAHSNSFTAGSGIAHGFYFNNCTNFSVVGCIAGNGIGSGAQGYGIYLNTTCNQFSVRDCEVSNGAVGTISDNTVDATAVKYISGNKGYITQSRGTATIAVGQTVATVTHGLSGTPTAQDVTITPTVLMTASAINAYRVITLTSTTFQVQSDVAVAGTGFGFGWSARIKGA